jgi:uridine kinase
MLRPFVVALAGGSASGKSTLAGVLAGAFLDRSVEVIPMDRFMRRDDPSAPKFFFRFQGVDMMDFNHPESADNAAILRATEASEAQIVILEGLMALAVPELRAHADLHVFVDLDADVRAIRRMERDIRTGRGNGDPAFIAAYYIECARVGHARYVEPSKAFADLIVRGDSDFASTASLLAGIVLDRVPSSRESA